MESSARFNQECKKNARLNSVIIALHLPELLLKDYAEQKASFIRDLKKRIIELRETFGEKLPFYLVITKCDFAAWIL